MLQTYWGGGGSGTYQNTYLHEIETSTTTIVSKTKIGTSSRDHNYDPDISASGQYVVFGSRDSDLVLNDTNDSADVFIRNTDTNITNRISVNNLGVEGNYSSYGASISENGLIVAFESEATNLSDAGTSGEYNVYFRDIEKDKTVHVASGYSSSISSNGKFIAYVSSNNVHVYDIESATLQRITSVVGLTPVLSSSGRYVAFTTPANGENFSDELTEFDLNVYDTESEEIITKIMNAIGKNGGGISLDKIYLDNKFSFSADESQFVFESKENFGIETSGYNSSDVFVIECCK